MPIVLFIHEHKLKKSYENKPEQDGPSQQKEFKNIVLTNSGFDIHDASIVSKMITDTIGKSGNTFNPFDITEVIKEVLAFDTEQ